MTIGDLSLLFGIGLMAVSLELESTLAIAGRTNRSLNMNGLFAD
jgi:hypothetical protein